MANWIFGEDYAGIEMNSEIQNNSKIMSWINQNMTSTLGDFWVFNPGVSEMELIELFEDSDIEDYEILYFTYLRSTWIMN